MKVRVSKQDWKKVPSNAVVILVPEEKEPKEDQIGVLDQMLDGLLTQMRASGELKGEQGETVVLFRPQGLRVERLVLAGNGPADERDFGSIRSSVHAALNKLKGLELESLQILAPRWLSQDRSVQAVTEGIVQGLRCSVASAIQPNAAASIHCGGMPSVVVSIIGLPVDAASRFLRWPLFAPPPHR